MEARILTEALDGCLDCAAGVPLGHPDHLCAAAVDVPPRDCPATAPDAGMGTTLRCVLFAHGPEVDHVADGMRWRDGEAPRGFMGLGRRL